MNGYSNHGFPIFNGAPEGTSPIIPSDNGWSAVSFLELYVSVPVTGIQTESNFKSPFSCILLTGPSSVIPFFSPLRATVGILEVCFGRSPPADTVPPAVPLRSSPESVSARITSVVKHLQSEKIFMCVNKCAIVM